MSQFTDRFKCVLEEVEKGNDSPGRVAEACGIAKSTAAEYIKKAKEFLEAEKSGRSQRSRRENEGKEERVTSRGGSVPATARLIDSTMAEVFKELAAKITWFTDALINIGWLTTIAAFQFAKIDPKDIPQKVFELTDPSEFINFVSQYLFAMIDASGDAARAIAERDERIRKLENALRVVTMFAKERISMLRGTLSELSARYEVAMSIIARYNLMDEYLDTLSKYMLAKTIAASALAPQPLLTPMEVQAQQQQQAQEAEAQVQLVEGEKK